MYGFKTRIAIFKECTSFVEVVIEKHPVYTESVVGILAKKEWPLRSRTEQEWPLRSRTEQPSDLIRSEASDLTSEGS